MKNLVLILGMFLLTSAVFGQAENSKHYIEGDFESVVDGDSFKYILSNIVYSGITSTSGSNLVGEESEEGFATFLFQEIETDYKNGEKEAYDNVKF